MASFIYFYSKFTDEFLLLTASALFGLLALYCYQWVVKRRRLGSAGEFVPAEVVKTYLNQLIGEAQFIRTQLFGILGGMNHDANADTFNSLLKQHSAPASHASNDTHATPPGGEVPSELTARLKALEAQLSEKEGLIVNINVEKTKLAQDLEALRNQKAAAPAAAAPAGNANNNNDELIKRIKSLEQQLAEYNMFEDDLANIKRIQQENEQLKKKIQEASSAPRTEPTKPTLVPDLAGPEMTVKTEVASKGPSLDQDSINSLLNGESPVPAEKTKTKIEKPVADDFEKLATSVETSIEAVAPAAPVAAAPVVERVVELAAEAPAAAPVIPITQEAAPPPAADATAANKSDEDLLKEFENLLNSG